VHSDLKEIDGGIRLTGTWKFASGVDQADWLWILTPSTESADGVLVPRSELQVVDDWQVVGLRGTGSKEVRLDDVFVPSRHILPAAVHRSVAQRHEALYDNDPTQRISSAVWRHWVCSCLLGTAHEMLRSFEKAMARRSSSLTGRLSAESPVLQVALAESSAELHCADLLFEADMRALRAWADTGDEPAPDAVAQVGLHAAYACRLMIRAAERLLECGGSNVIYDGNELGRLVRDILAGTRHAIVSWEENAERFGRTRFNLPPLRLRGT
jgi:3-hydroxy-9,10-secoandrosta-1,3,5(10)-triene-9,17-dione monooxygenase